MPHNIFLHSALVLSRGVNRASKAAVKQAILYYSIESGLALFVSFVINLFVVSVFSKAFYNSDPASVCDVDDGFGTVSNMTCRDIGLSEADGALHKSLGAEARLVWGVGLLASGQSSTMTGTYVGQFVMNGFLDIHLPKWKRTFLTRSLAIVPAMAFAIFAGSRLDRFSEGLNVLQSVQLPFALLPLVRFTCASGESHLFFFRAYIIII